MRKKQASDFSLCSICGLHACSSSAQLPLFFGFLVGSEVSAILYRASAADFLHFDKHGSVNFHLPRAHPAPTMARAFPISLQMLGFLCLGIRFIGW
jgi:hypothetical protein